MSRRRRRRRAFTLVELLVVIGIIAVLIAILLPTLAGARRSAATIKCASNLRQLGAAVFLYANENRQHVPTNLSTYPSGMMPWYDQLAKYVLNRPATGTPPSIINDPDFARTIFAGCPAFTFSLHTAGPFRTATGYGMTTLPASPLEPPNPDRYNNYIDPGLPGTKRGRHFKINEFRNPANRALMADANGFGGLITSDPGPDAVYTPAPGNNIQGDIDYFRHSRRNDMKRAGTNVLFCDGHVEPCTPWQVWWAVRDPARRAAGNDNGR